jgi:tRNA threonylcarbamoyladenosine biosynthesis protein TsaB
VTILAFDTVTTVFSVALTTPAGFWYSEVDSGLKHESLILTVAESLLNLAHIHVQTLEAVACVQGPGSFTGIRIGFATAQGIARALNIPLKTAPTLDCMAYGAQGWPGYVVPSIDAKTHKYFSALYRDGQRLSPYCDIAAAGIAQWFEGSEKILLTGPGADLLYADLKPLVDSQRMVLDPHRRRGIAPALSMLAQESPIEPLYVRNALSSVNEIQNISKKGEEH